MHRPGVQSSDWDSALHTQGKAFREGRRHSVVKNHHQCCGALPVCPPLTIPARTHVTGGQQEQSRQSDGQGEPWMADPGSSAWKKARRSGAGPFPAPRTRQSPWGAGEVINHSPRSLCPGLGGRAWKSSLPPILSLAVSGSHGRTGRSRPLAATWPRLVGQLPALKDRGQPPAVPRMLERR